MIIIKLIVNVSNADTFEHYGIHNNTLWTGHQYFLHVFFI